MVSYRGPYYGRVGAHFAAIMGNHGETGTWRKWVSSTTETGSAVWAGIAPSSFYTEQIITALWAAPQMGESRFRETQLPAGQEMAGDAVLSTPFPFGVRDEVIWRGVTYRIEGDSTPVEFAGRTWYRTIVRRGDVTG